MSKTGYVADAVYRRAESADTSLFQFPDSQERYITAYEQSDKSGIWRSECSSPTRVGERERRWNQVVDLVNHTRRRGRQALTQTRTKKYLILKEGTLNMMKNETSTSISSQIPLREVTNVQRLETKGYCFEVVRDMGSSSATKSYFVSLKSDAELYEWMVKLSLIGPSAETDKVRTIFTIAVHSWVSRTRQTLRTRFTLDLTLLQGASRDCPKSGPNC